MRWLARRARTELAALAILAAISVPRSARAAEKSESTGDSSSHLSELLFVSTEVGVQYVGLEQLHLNSELVPSTARSIDTGPMVGAMAGVRLLFFTLGPRFRYATFRDWDLWSLDAEVAFRVPLGPVEPSLMLGAGYSRLGRLENRSLHAQGYNIRLGLGVDYYLSHLFSVGANVAGEIVGLTRPGVDLNEPTGSVREDVYKLDGSSLGVGMVGSLVAGFHL